MKQSPTVRKSALVLQFQVISSAKTLSSQGVDNILRLNLSNETFKVLISDQSVIDAD